MKKGMEMLTEVSSPAFNPETREWFITLTRQINKDTFTSKIRSEDYRSVKEYYDAYMKKMKERTR